MHYFKNGEGLTKEKPTEKKKIPCILDDKRRKKNKEQQGDQLCVFCVFSRRFTSTADI